MGRLARVVVPGLPHHVTQWGFVEVEVRSFDDDRDRRIYLELLATYCGLCSDPLVKLFSINPLADFRLVEWLAAGQPRQRSRRTGGTPEQEDPWEQKNSRKTSKRDWTAVSDPPSEGEKKGTKWTVPS